MIKQEATHYKQALALLTLLDIQLAVLEYKILTFN